MAGMGDTSGDIQPVSDHVKDILQMTRDSEMMQSYVRVSKVDDEEDDDGGGGGGVVNSDGNCAGGGGGGGRGDSESDGVAGTVGHGGVGGGGVLGSAADRRLGRKGRAAPTGRKYRRCKGDGGGGTGVGGVGGGMTTTFNELAEEFKTRKSGTGGGGGGGVRLGGGWNKRHKRDSRSRLLEEVYTDKDRAAAVNLGTRDIKASLRMKRRQDRNQTMHIPSTAESPTLLALARHCINDVSVSLEFIDKVSGRALRLST